MSMRVKLMDKVYLAYCDKGYERISRTQARNSYNKYEKVYCAKANVHPFKEGNAIGLQKYIEAEDYRPLMEGVDDFDRVIRALEKWKFKGTVWFWAETKQNQKIN